MRRLFGCPDIVSLTEKFFMARNSFQIFTENNPVMGYSKTFFIPEAKGLMSCMYLFVSITDLESVLKKTQHSRMRLIVTDGVFSMDGDIAPLKYVTRAFKKL